MQYFEIINNFLFQGCLSRKILEIHP